MAAPRLLPGWPAMMTAETAGLYLDVGGPNTFRRRATEWPGFPQPDHRTGLWSRKAIDAWISGNALDLGSGGSHESARKELDTWTP